MALIKVVEFELNGQKYGANMDGIMEIVRNSKVTRVPNVKNYVKGVMNLRGNIAIAIDLHHRLGLPASDENEQARIIIASRDDNIFGFCVDAVTRVHEFNDEDIEPPNDKVTGDNDYIYGLAKSEDYLIAILDLERLMETGDLALELNPDMYTA